MHGPDETEIVNATPDMGKDVAHLDTTLAILLEAERGPHQVAGLPLGYQVSTGKGLPMVFVQHRFRVEGIDLGQSSIEKEKDHMLSCGWEMGCLDLQRSGE
jgi:hypothetical protein